MPDRKSLIETIISIIVGVITIVTSLAAVLDGFKNAFSWFLRHWWSLALVALVITVCYWLLVYTKKGQSVRQSIATRFQSVVNLRTVIVILFVVNAFNGGVLAASYRLRPKVKSITGIVYYQRCEQKSGLSPAADVKVFLSGRDLKSNPTGPDGRFSISGIPADFQIHQLTAERGGAYYPMPYKEGEGDYEVIPRSCERPIIWEVHTPWRMARSDQCFSETEESTNIRRRYLLQTMIPAEGKSNAVLTVELQDTINVRILNAFVLSPSEQSGLYREDMEGLNEHRVHKWVFDLPVNGLTVQLEICLGSNDNPAALSEQHLRTYYELR
jgi:hypothetical protein